jgi:crotonobetaine/carnitine-CoA ligase
MPGQTDIEHGPHRTVVEVLRRRAERIGDKPWLVTDDATFTYAQIDETSNRMVHGLARLGVGAGETVLLLLPNIADYVVCWCAIAKARAIEVPINTAYRGSVLLHQINDSLASTMIVASAFLERVEVLAADLQHLERCVVHGAGRGLEDARRAAPKLAARCDFIAYEDLFDDDAGPPDDAPRYCDIAAIMYTSGTTGVSKGVMVPHAHSFEYACTAGAAIELAAPDIYYAPLPLFHVAGQWAVVYACAIRSATAVLTRGFSLQGFWDDVTRHEVTCTFLLGAMANFLYRQPEAADDAATPLAKVLMSPLIPQVEDFKRRFGVRVSTAYGSTELGGGGTFHVLDLPNARSCGRPQSPKYELRIVDQDDEEVPAGCSGEIVVRPREPWIAMAGYWNRPEATQEAWRNLWLHTGDVGRLDDDGNLYFIDRTKDAIRRRGENISSLEVENEINAHPAVLESAAFPVASADTEQEVACAVVPKPGQSLEPEDLIRFLEPRMAPFMVPRYVDVVQDLPKTPTGKIQKFGLRERGLTATTWDRVTAGVVPAR